jgi:hypothetical protein
MMMLQSGCLAVKRRKAFAAFFAAACIAGCSYNDEIASAIVAPGKYQLYTCEDLTVRGRDTAKRERELKALMEKSEQDTGGAFVNMLAYRTEYLTARGELMQMEAAASAKNCASFHSISEQAVR